jgi:rhodanese-related sulfurtransferase
MKNIWLSFLLIISIIACTEAQQIKRLNVKEFKELMDKTSNKTVLDVRTNDEVAQGVLAQATQIDYNGGDFESQLEKLDKNKPVFIYCAVGGRSGSASSILAKKGFKKVYNLEGGINAWIASGFPTTGLKR